MRTSPASPEYEPRAVKRVVLIVLDGLRPDAIPRFGLRHLSELVRRGASSMRATTVGPSVTVACMASLLTGVSPDAHGVHRPRSLLARRPAKLHPMPRALKEASVRCEAFLTDFPWFLRPLAGRLARALHLEATFVGRGSALIVEEALPRLRAMTDGFVMMHWPDGDDAGHDHGWMSPEYGNAARRMDEAMGAVVEALSPFDREDTLLIATADHGGGGADPRDHDSAHPTDRTIPLIFAGGGVAPRALREPVSLLDIPPTVLWALGAPIPGTYHGRPLVELFERDMVPV